MNETSMNSSSVTIQVPLQFVVTVSVGTPVLSQSPAQVVSRRDLPFELEGQATPLLPAIDTATFHRDALAQSTFTWKAAQSLALASKLAYETDDAVNSTCVTGTRNWGFESCEFIDVDDTQCFVALTSEFALVSFRGTESRGDWLRNINVPGRTRDYGVVHRGFLGAFQAVESRLRSALSEIGDRKLIVTGHSLGGALATVIAAEWQAFLPAAWVVTFGQPAAGSGSFRMFFVQHYGGRFFRFVNDDDIVPRVPPGYEHVGRLLHFDSRGRLRNGASLPSSEQESVSSMQQESISAGPPMLTEAEYRSLQSQIGQEVIRVNRSLTESQRAPQMEGLFPSISDHNLDTYISKIVANSGG
ncbi:lipase family protein [Schlesneria sp.]|uniref:lipase family protein n=1 Tax=Schlesneria sp. TaxID=2762018 RepID=UPI002EE711DC